LESRSEIDICTESFDVLRFNDKEKAFTRMRDEVVVEAPINLYVNGDYLATFLALPVKLRELAYGHLASEGVIRSLEDVEGIAINGFSIEVEVCPDIAARVKAYSVIKTRYSSCGQAPEDYLKLLDSLIRRKVSSSSVFEARVVVEAVKLLNKLSTIYRRTGGTHAALIVDSSLRILGFAEDIGRHNAVDKAVGSALLSGVQLNGMDDVIMVCTGRLTSEMVLKAVRLNVPVLASISAPSSMGIAIARRIGLTLIGFVRGSRFNVYSHPERLIVK